MLCTINTGDVKYVVFPWKVVILETTYLYMIARATTKIIK